MNKTKIGLFIKQLREETKKENNKPLTKEGAADLFNVSVKTINEWENGTILPSIENICKICGEYNITIDELLDGKKYHKRNFSEEYLLSNDRWYNNFSDDEGLYLIRNKEILKIVKRFKELILKFITSELTLDEDEELIFLFNKFYTLTDYAREFISNDKWDESFKFKFVLNSCEILKENVSIEEKFWEVQKLYEPNSLIKYKYPLDIDDLIDSNEVLIDRFKNLEDWEKDLMLATFQNVDPISVDPSKYGSKGLESYEKENSEKFDKEMHIKKRITQMIKYGACLNKHFFNCKKKEIEQIRIIDRLEYLYNLCLKPLELSFIDDNGNIKYYKVENNSKNRFIKSLYYAFKAELVYKDLNILYELTINNDEMPKEIIEYLSESNLYINKNSEYIKDDLKMLHPCLFNEFKSFKEKENEIKEGLEEIKILENRLKKGDIYDLKVEYSIIGGLDPDSIRKHVIKTKSDITYKEFIKNRNKKRTKELLNDLPNLSVDEIRKKYFEIEVIENE